MEPVRSDIRLIEPRAAQQTEVTSQLQTTAEQKALLGQHAATNRADLAREDTRTTAQLVKRERERGQGNRRGRPARGIPTDSEGNRLAVGQYTDLSRTRILHSLDLSGHTASARFETQQKTNHPSDTINDVRLKQAKQAYQLSDPDADLFTLDKLGESTWQKETG